MANTFRLGTMLKLREQARDERRRDLAQAYEAERILRERVEELQQEIAATHARTRQLAGEGSVNVEGLLNTRRYQLLMKSQVAATEQQITQVLEEVERRRQALIESDRDVKVLEKLRERQQQQQEIAEAKREAKQLDEAGLRAFLRQHEVTP
jgi:flagellar FliJ protein